jgi:multidrug efflux pump subunit AcrA (membrane-fusion protein)
MRDDDNQRTPPDHQLPLPEAQRGSTVADEFKHPERADARRIGQSFADPNSLDDARLGKSFEERVAGKKEKKPPLVQRVHKPANRRVLWIFILSVVGVFLLIFVLGWLPRHKRDKETQQQADTERNADPVVEVTHVKREKSGGGLVVPGSTSALTEAYVYARANGYLKKRLVDIGDHVREGQVLAIIDAPDLDQQVDQAREQVKQAEAQLQQQRSQLALATVTVERYRVLVGKGVFSRQEGDQREADFRAQQANVAAAERNVEAFKANLRRSIALQQFEYVRSPFTGVVTQRNVDVGALISAQGSSGGSQGPAPQGQSSSSGGSQQSGQTNNAGSSGSVNTAATPAQSPGQGGPLFGLAQVERLRILVSVPEGYASSIRTGSTAQVNVQEYPQAAFFGTVTRASAAVDQNTRTVLTEVQLDNRDGKLLPGMYAVVTFPPAPGAQAPLVVPGDAIAIRGDRSVIAAVVDGKIRLLPIVIGRDYGPSTEVLSGLHEGDLIVTNVTDDVTEGRKVKTQLNAQEAAAANQKPEQSQPPGGTTQYGNQSVTDVNLQSKQSQQNQKAGGKPQKSESSSGSKP